MASQTSHITSSRINSAKSLDPAHPSLTAAFHELPSYKSALFRLRAYPFAMLQKHQSASYPFNELAIDMSDCIFTDSRKSAPMALASLVGKNSVHPSAVIRNQIKRRMKEALRLVVARGAKVGAAGRITLNFEEAGESQWIIQSMFQNANVEPLGHGLSKSILLSRLDVYFSSYFRNVQMSIWGYYPRCPPSFVPDTSDCNGSKNGMGRSTGVPPLNPS